jgi:hypothetical protein
LAFSGAGRLLIKKEPTGLGDGRTATQTPAEHPILIRTSVESGWRPFPGISILVKRLPFAKPAPIRGVHLQKADRRSAYRGAPDNKDSVALEVLIPLVLPRMKEPDERAAFRVKSAQVRSLVRIAVVAGESEVSAVVSSAMLASDDVLDVIGEEWLRVLRQAAVFAAITGSFTDSLPEPLVHQAA